MIGPMNDTIAVRPGEELDNAKLHRFLKQEIKGLPEGDLEIRQFGAGHSNLTYALSIDDWEAVLRRPPLGPVAPKAHDMEREFTILSALHPVFPTAPRPFVFSQDPEIVGSPFFVMERKHGIVLDTEFPKGVEPSAELGRQISELMVDQLVKLHAIDYKETPLVDMAKPEGFLKRQVSSWINRYERAKTDDIPEAEKVAEWLLAHIPESGEPTIIHYDFKLNNTMFSADFTEVSGVFDWEMTTVGDPLADLGAAMSYWMEDKDPVALKKGFGKVPVTVTEGFYTRQEFIDRYAQKSGRDASNINFYIIFALFKLAAICQQIYYRFMKGQTADNRFAQLGPFIEALIQHALKTAKEQEGDWDVRR